MLLLEVGWITAIHFFRSLSKFNQHKLKCIQNSAARIVSNISRCTSITPVLKKLHWLPVEQRMVFKTATLVYKFLHTGCLGILLHIFFPTAVLIAPGLARVVAISLSFQSSTIVFINLSSSLNSFTADAPTVWNALPDEIRTSLSLASFRKQLKTYLYIKAYPP